MQRAWARFLTDPRAAIYGAIKSGRLPACKLIGGSYAIYPGELLRAFPLLAQQAKANAPKHGSGTLTFPAWDVSCPLRMTVKVVVRFQGTGRMAPEFSLLAKRSGRRCSRRRRCCLAADDNDARAHRYSTGHVALSPLKASRRSVLPQRTHSNFRCSYPAAFIAASCSIRSMRISAPHEIHNMTHTYFHPSQLSALQYRG